MTPADHMVCMLIGANMSIFMLCALDLAQGEAGEGVEGRDGEPCGEEGL